MLALAALLLFPNSQACKVSGFPPGPRRTIEKILTPNSYNAKMRVNGKLYSYSLDEKSKDWNTIKPQLVFYGVNSHHPIVIGWKNLKTGHVGGDFRSFVQTKLGSLFKGAKKLVLVTHGWGWDGDLKHCKDNWVSDMAKKINLFENDHEQSPPTVTMGICWNSKALPSIFWPMRTAQRTVNLCKLSWFAEILSASPLIPPLPLYFKNVCTTAKVGELLARLITAMKEIYPGLYVHGIGHSLGAHVMGNIRNFGKVKVKFEDSSWDIHVKQYTWGLTSDSADLVDNLHTDGAYYGTYQSKGHIDFFAGK